VILRPHPDGTLLIGQPAHALLSGRMADEWAWPYQPRDDVRLAALQHDIGMAAWDAAPVLDPERGLPYSFTSMPRETHVRLWSQAARLVVAQSPYAALLVSLHGTGLYERYVPKEQHAVQPVRGYLETERTFQDGIVAALGADRGEVDRNAALLRCWDWLSLFACTASADDGSLDGVPSPGGTATLRAHMPGGDPGAVTVTPWPFRPEQVSVELRGRLLSRPCDSQAALDRALAEAPIEAIRVTLRPG
jgi:Protein of unknown function (DUF3891)